MIIGLAVVWKYSTPTILGRRLARQALRRQADPGTINFVPRPDWYFYFLFYLLRIFKWPESVILGTVGIPTICLILLLALPFIDVRTERRLSRRPVAIVAAILVVISMGVLTYKGAAAKEALGSELVGGGPDWAQKQDFADNPQAVAGREAVRPVRLPELPHVPRRRRLEPRRAGPLARGREEQGHRSSRSTTSMPACVNPGSPMPSFAGLGEENLRKLATFLEASKGPK